MRVDLGGVRDAGGGQPESPYRPTQVLGLVGATQRQQFTQRRLVDLDDRDAGGLQIHGLVANRQRHLVGGIGQRLVVTHERPRQNRHRPGQHALHRFVGQRLRVGDPLDRHRPRPGHVAVQDRRTHTAAAVGLHPAVLGSEETRQLLGEVLHHVVALRFAVHQHVEPEPLL